MRVILKPGAILILLSIVGILAFVIISKKSSVVPSPVASDFVPVSSSPTPATNNVVADNFYAFGGPVLNYGKQTRMDGPDKPAGNATYYRYTIQKVPKDIWEVSTGAQSMRAISAGEKLVYHIWARSSTKNVVEMLVEENKTPYKRYLSERVTLTPEWKEYIFPFTITDDYPQPSGVAARVHMGASKGTIDLAGLKVLPAP